MSEFDKVFESEKSQHQIERQAERSEKLRRKREAEEKAKKAAEKRSKAAKKFIAIALAALLILGFLFGGMVVKIIKLRKELAEIQLQYDVTEEKIAELSSELDRVSSVEYIIEQARYKLGMIKEGELRYIILDDKE